MLLIAILIAYFLNSTQFILAKDENETPRLLQHLQGTRYFVRLVSKLSIFNYTTIFEYSAGFRINYDIKSFDLIARSNEARRLTLHRSIEAELEKYGLEGHACLFKMFCELQMATEQDLITRIVKMVFRSYYAYTCPDVHTCSKSLAWMPYMLYLDGIEHV